MYDILSDFIYGLNCNILSFSEGITIQQKSLHTFHNLHDFYNFHNFCLVFHEI